jgi:hypothetical protein
MNDLTIADLAGTSPRFIRGKVSYIEAARKSSTPPDTGIYNLYAPANIGVRHRKAPLVQPT